MRTRHDRGGVAKAKRRRQVAGGQVLPAAGCCRCVRDRPHDLAVGALASAVVEVRVRHPAERALVGGREVLLAARRRGSPSGDLAERRLVGRDVAAEDRCRGTRRVLAAPHEELLAEDRRHRVHARRRLGRPGGVERGERCIGRPRLELAGRRVEGRLPDGVDGTFPVGATHEEDAVTRDGDRGTGTRRRQLQVRRFRPGRDLAGRRRPACRRRPCPWAGRSRRGRR